MFADLFGCKLALHAVFKPCGKVIILLTLFKVTIAPGVSKGENGLRDFLAFSVINILPQRVNLFSAKGRRRVPGNLRL